VVGYTRINVCQAPDQCSTSTSQSSLYSIIRIHIQSGVLVDPALVLWYICPYRAASWWKISSPYNRLILHLKTGPISNRHRHIVAPQIEKPAKHLPAPDRLLRVHSQAPGWSCEPLRQSRMYRLPRIGHQDVFRKAKKVDPEHHSQYHSPNRVIRPVFGTHFEIWLFHRVTA
jgi:hypothetical protein